MRVDLLNNCASSTFQTTIGRVGVVASLLNLRKDDMAQYCTGAQIDIHQTHGGSSDRSENVSLEEIGSGGRGQQDKPTTSVKSTEAATKRVFSNNSNPKGQAS